MIQSPPSPLQRPRLASLKHDAIAGHGTPTPPAGSRTETSLPAGLPVSLREARWGRSGSVRYGVTCVTQTATCGRKAQCSSHTPWGFAEPPAAIHGTPGWGREPRRPGAGSGSPALGLCSLRGRGCRLRPGGRPGGHPEGHPGGHPGGPEHKVGPPVLDARLGHLPSNHTKSFHEHTKHVF